MSPHELDLKLAALKGAVSQIDPPDAIGARLQAAIADQARASPRTVRRGALRMLAWPLALAAAVAFVGWTMSTLDRVDSAPTVVAGEAIPAATDFMPLVPMTELAEAENSYVVSTSLPRARLAEFGLPVNPSRAADAVNSELLVRSDGAILAVRFIE